MIKVPGTAEGIPAFQQLISEGININVTLLFLARGLQEGRRSLHRGSRTSRSQGWDLSKIASVASFFISRIDNAVDAIVTERLKNSKEPQRAGTVEEPSGQSRDRQRANKPT